MKKIIIAGGILLSFLGAKAQQTEYFYQVNGLFKDDRTAGLNGKWVHFKPVTGNGLFISPVGDIGIGNIAPTQKLDVSGSLKATTGFFTTAPTGTQSYATNTDRVNASLAFAAGYPVSPTSNVRSLYFMDMPISNMDAKPAMWFGVTDRGNYSRLRYRCETGGNSQFILFDKLQAENFTVTDDGSENIILKMPKANSSIMIGTSTNLDGADFYKLSVAGKMRAHEVKVYTTWADYVFEDSYKLKPLAEVEQFINENGHLPNVPSAKVIEEKGLEVGNMIKIQQEKIEELTLYAIEQQKENDQLRKDVEELKAAIKALSERK